MHLIGYALVALFLILIFLFNNRILVFVLGVPKLKLNTILLKKSIVAKRLGTSSTISTYYTFRATEKHDVFIKRAGRRESAVSS